MDAMVEIEQARQAGQNLAQVVERLGVWRASWRTQAKSSSDSRLPRFQTRHLLPLAQL